MHVQICVDLKYVQISAQISFIALKKVRKETYFNTEMISQKN